MKNLNILILEDNKLDAELIKEEIASYKIDFISELVETKKDFIAAIQNFQPDLILSDYSLPQFTGFEALDIAKELVQNIPFILVTGHLSEEVAVDAIKRGTWDYVLKENLLRLGPAIENALKLKEEKDKNRESEKELIKLSTAVKQSANSIVITDTDGKITYTNPKFTNLTGITAKEALGKNPNILRSGKQNKEFYIKLWETIKAGKTWKGEFHNKSKNGDYFWEQATISPIKDADGNITNFLAIKEDITLRKEVEQKLIKSEKLNRAVTQTAADAIITTDLDGNVTSWNNTAEKLFGYKYSDIINNNIDIIIPPKYKEGHRKGIKKIKTDKNKKIKNKTHEFYGLRIDGKEFPIEISFSKWEVNKQRFITSIIRDVSERKKIELKLIKSEELNRAVTQTAADAIITTDLDGIVTSWNNAAIQLFGYSFSEMINTNINKIIPPRYLKDHEMGLKKLNSGKTKKVNNQSNELFGLRKDGTEFPIELSLSNWEVDNERFVTSIIRDITERKQAELVLQKAYSEVENLKKQLEEENVSLKEEISLSFNYEDLVYSSVEISDVLTQVEQVSNTDATVLILGETGTGKELIAKAIHNISDRKKEPLIYVNCAAIPTELIESELFGHKKGAFTGAINNRIGKFQLADKGTLFLDEIGEMPINLQPKLLRAIQNAEITPVGDSKVHKLDIRIIVATNKNLEKEVDENRFREDLFFRLNVFPITVPPLRERIEDIPVLIDHFINKYSKKYRKEIKYISNKTLQQLKVYLWPGNVRELENLVERAVIISNNETLVFQGFDKQINTEYSKRNNTHTTLEEIQSNHIIKTLNLCQWKISGEGGAASLLDIKPSTLRDRMKKFGIVRPK